MSARLHTARTRLGGEPVHLREAVVVFLGSLLLSCLMFWPLPLDLSDTVAKDAGDPLLQTWQLAWDGHALLHQPLHLWQANLFFPEKNSLAFSDALVGYAPMGIFGSGPHAALRNYNVLFLLVYALSVTGPYLLARELGLGRVGALVCGLSFAFSPWRWAQAGHLHILSSGSLALCLALLVRGYRRPSPRAAFAGWAVAAWQLLIGVSLGLMLLYLLGLLTVFAAVCWWRAGKPEIPRALIKATAGGVAVLGLALVLVAPVYLHVQHDHPEAKRGLEQVAAFSPPLRGFLTTSPDNTLWGRATTGNRDQLPAFGEKVLFPGLSTVLLAVLGLCVGTFSRRMRIGLLIAGLLAFTFSLGLEFLDGKLTYRLLYEHAPGWSGIRTPGRLHTFTTLVLGVLAGAGAHWLVSKAQPALGRLRRPRARTALGIGLGALLCLPVLAEGASFQRDVPGAGVLAGPTHPTPAFPPAGLDQARAPYLQIPPDDPLIFEYMLWSTDGFPKMVNGRSGFDPTVTSNLKAVAQGFPDAPSVAALRAAGIRTVVLHPSYAPGTPWESATTKPLTGLGVTMRSVGDVILYDLGR